MKTSNQILNRAVEVLTSLGLALLLCAGIREGTPEARSSDPLLSWTLQSRTQSDWTNFELDWWHAPGVAIHNGTIAVDGSDTVYGNGLFVSVGSPYGSGTQIRTSVDGATWVDRMSGASSSLHGVTYGSGLFVVVGDGGAILTSADAVTWTPRQTPTTARLVDVAYGGVGFVVVGVSGTVVTSPDGIQWTAQTCGTVGDLVSIAYGNGVFVAGGYEGNVRWTSDGVTWTAAATGQTTPIITLAFGNGTFIVGGKNRPAQKSIDGRSWESLGGMCGYDRLVAVAYDGGTFVAETVQGDIVMSSVTVDWSWKLRSPGGSGEFNSVAFGNGTFVAVGAGGVIKTSSDGFAWTTRDSGVFNSLYEVVFGSDRFVAVGTSGVVLTSTNGSSWSPANSNTSETLYAVAFGAGRYMAVGTGGAIVTSTSGTSWSQRDAGASQTLWDVAYGNGAFVVGTDRVSGDYFSHLLTSTDGGSNWSVTYRFSTRRHDCVAFLQGQFVAFSGSYPIVSSDGLNWSSGPYFTGGPYSGGPISIAPLRALSQGGGYLLSLDNFPGYIASYPDTVQGRQLGNSRGGEITAMGYGNGVVVATAPGGEIYSTQVASHGVTVDAVPIQGGEVRGGGAYQKGESVTVTASTRNGYSFRNWTESGAIVSTSLQYTFTATASRKLVANFYIPVYYNVVTSAEPPANGSTSGAGRYLSGTMVTVTATPVIGYAVSHWTENEAVVSSNASYTFTINGHRDLVAHFVVAASLSLQANPVEGGVLQGAGNYGVGTQRQISAVANAGWKFVDWNDGVTTNPRSVTVPPGGITYTANFALRTLVARDDMAFTIPNGAVVVPVLDNDTASYPLSITGVVHGSHGSAMANSDGTITYTPAPGFVDRDTFTYDISDGHGESGTATVTVGHLFLSGAGTYSRVILTDPVQNGTSGWIRMVVTGKGRFTATLRHGGFVYRFKGALGPDGSMQRLIGRGRDRSPLAVTLTLDPGAASVRCSVWDGNNTATAEAALLTYDAKESPAPHAGSYNSLLSAAAGAGSAEGIPYKYSYLRIQVKPSGTVSAIGRLGDGTTFSTSGVLVSETILPLYVALYGPGARGCLVGEIEFLPAVASDDCNGLLRWFKPTQVRDAYYAEGLTLSMRLFGSRYTAPPRGTRVVEFPDSPGNAVVEAGIAAAFDAPQIFLNKSVTLWRTNQVTIDMPGEDRLLLKVNPSAGTFRGSFREQTTLKKREFSGVVLQKQRQAGGFFLGDHQSGYVTLLPK